MSTGSIQVVTASILNPVTISGTVNLNNTSITVSQSNPVTNVTVSNFPATQYVTASVANPVWVTGTTHIDNAVLTVSQSNPVTSVVVSNLPTTQLVTSSIANPVWVTGALAISESGTFTVTGTVHLDNTSLTVSQSNPTTSVTVSNFPASQVVTASIANPVTITGSVYVLNPSGGGSSGASDGLTGTIAPHTATLVGAVNPSGNLVPFTTDASGNLLVTVIGMSTGSIQVVTASITNPVTISGTTHIDNVSLTVSQSNPVTSLSVSNFPSSQIVTASIGNAVTISGTVHIDNTSVTVSQSNPVTSVTVSNLPAIQLVTSSLANPVWTTGTMHLDNTSLTVSQSNPVTSVAVSNLPASQVVTASIANPVTITGSVYVLNPSGGGSSGASDGLTGTIAPSTATLVGAVNTSGNLVPLTTDVSGNLLVTVVGLATGSIQVVTASIANPVTITGSVYVLNPSGGGGGSGDLIATGTLNPASGVLVLGVNPSNTAVSLITDANAALIVNVASGVLSSSMFARYGTSSIPLQADVGGILKVMTGQPGSIDTFGHQTIAYRQPQIQVQFFATTPTSSLNMLYASGGSSSAGPGVGIFTSNNNTNGRVSGTTPAGVVYTSHYELYAAWTVGFTSGVANSYQRIGLYNDTDGFSVGYSGTTFGAWARYSGTDTFTPQSSFNADVLTGAAGTRFTLNTLPVAMNPTTINLYRIRMGWLGVANVTLEVLSPDGDFVIAHVWNYTNTGSLASVTNPNMPVKLDINKSGAGAAILTMTCGCWVAGSTQQPGNDLKSWVNTTNTPLTASQAWSGSWSSTAGYATLGLMIASDQASTTNGVHINWSNDGLNIDDQETLTFTSVGSSNNWQFPVRGAYFQVTYQNAAAPQTTFRLSAIVKTSPVNGGVYDISTPIPTGAQAQLVQAWNTASTPLWTVLSATTNTTAYNSGSTIAVSGGAVIAATNASRNMLILTADPGNMYNVRFVLASTGSTTASFPLTPGGSFTIERSTSGFIYTGPIYGQSEVTGNAVNICVIEL